MTSDKRIQALSMVRRMTLMAGALGLLVAIAGGTAAQSESSAAVSLPGLTQSSTTVFFDFDTSDLNEEARELISMAVMEVGDSYGISAHVTGHSSTAHSEPGTAVAREYNVELSRNRAEAVKSELVRLGISENAITTEGMGSRELLVETGPGVIEPMNRRAVIELRRP